MCFCSLGTSLSGNVGISRGIATQKPRVRLEQAAALTGDYEFHGENERNANRFGKIFHLLNGAWC